MIQLEFYLEPTAYVISVSIQSFQARPAYLNLCVPSPIKDLYVNTAVLEEGVRRY